MSDHILRYDAYTLWYGAPSYAEDPDAWHAWVSRASALGLGSRNPVPLSMHTEDCPACAEGAFWPGSREAS